MKNKTKIFFVLTILAILLAVTTVNATDNNTNVASDTLEVQETSSEAISTQPVQTSTDKQNVDTKNANNKDKIIKTQTKTVEVNDGASLINMVNQANTDTENDEYIIDLTNGNYNISQVISFNGNVKKLLINGNNNIINSTLTIVNVANHDITYNNITIYCMAMMNTGNMTINNSYIKTTNFILNNGNFLSINNSLINTTINNNQNLIIDDYSIFGESFTITGQGNILTNNTEYQEMMAEKTGTYNFDKTFENTIIDRNITNYANMQIINTNITAQITNNANLTLVNCSLSDNNISVYYYDVEINGAMLITNKFGSNLTLINCTMNNNTFNLTNPTYNFPRMFFGAIYNNGTMNLVNSCFYNNSLGYAVVTDDWANGRYSGEGTVVVNNGTLNVDECNFTGNFAGNSSACISNYGLLKVDNSVFEDNTAVRHGGAISNEGGNASITNTNFTQNNVEDFLNTDGITILGGGAIAGIDGNILIDSCVFDENHANVDTMELAGAYSSGGAIGTNKANITVTNNKFINNKANRGAAISLGDYANGMFTFNYIINNTFEHNIGEAESKLGSSIIFDNGHANITNNSFTDNTNASYVIDNFIGFEQDQSVERGANRQHNEVINLNTFTNNSVTKNTISIVEAENVTVEDNTYTNTTINDTLTLDIPDKVYAGEPTTIKGTYTINNPENYDEDILEQTQFNVYINGELDQTVDTLEFTINPADNNMIITVQPTISPTRKSAIIKPTTLNFTLEDVTATIGETAQLTAQITVTVDDENVEVNTGRVYFKVNGKILRDIETGRILYADVTENTATLDIQVPKSWNNETSIEATFTGNDELPEIMSNVVTPTIATPETQEIEFTVVDTTATAGSEVTITVTTKNLDNGKVVLKVNGKTVKATDNKLYAKVTGNNLTFTYTVPKTLKAGEYTIKAVYTSGATKLEAESKLTIG